MEKIDCKEKCNSIIEELFDKDYIYRIDVDNYSERIKEVLITAFHISWDGKLKGENK